MGEISRAGDDGADDLGEALRDGIGGVLGAVLDLVSGPAGVVDVGGRLLASNAALAALAGAPSDELRGRRPEALGLAVQRQPVGGTGYALVRALAAPERVGVGPHSLADGPAAAARDAAQALAGAVTVAHITAVLERQLPAFGATGLLISLAEGPRLRLVSSVGYPADVLSAVRDQAMGTSTPMVEVVRDRRPMFVERREDYVRGYPHREAAARASGKHAWAFLPLVAAGTTVGVWCLSWAQERRFSGEEQAVLVALSGLVAQALSRAQAVEAERTLAQSLQGSLLPSRLPEVAGCAVAVRYAPAVAGLDVGGDFYDVVPLPRGGAGVVVGDAAGHSAAAAALMGQARSAVRAYAAEGHDPATVLVRANRFLITAETESFVTCVYASVDAAGEHLVVGRAGHPPPLLVDADGARWLEVPGGLPLGMERGATYPVTTVSLTPGDRLVLVTDGLLDLRGAAADEGEEQVRSRALAARHLPLEEFADALLGDEDREDDVAVLVLERVPGGGVPRRRQAAWSLAPAAPVEVGRVRRDVDAQLAEWEWGRTDEVLLVLSELLTNALSHVGGRVDVLLTLDGDELVVSVDDRSPSVPLPRAAAADATGGRGLAVVRALAHRWGVDPHGTGKTVWAALRRTI